MEVGSILQGKVTGIAPFGAFVELEDGKTGLVHISEVASEYVENINNHLKVGQTVKVKVMSIEPNGKISISIKRAMENSAKKSERSKRNYSYDGKHAPEEFEFVRKKKTEDMSFEDKLLKFKQDSDEKMLDLKRNTEGKRSGGGYHRAN